MSHQFLPKIDPADQVREIVVSGISGGSITVSGKSNVSASTNDSLAFALNLDSKCSLNLQALASGSTTSVNCPDLTIATARIVSGTLYFTGQKIGVISWTHISGDQWQIDAQNNGLSESDVDGLLIAMDEALPSGSLICSGCMIQISGTNSPPSGASSAAISNLTDRGIAVYVS